MSGICTRREPRTAARQQQRRRQDAPCATCAASCAPTCASCAMSTPPPLPIAPVPPCWAMDPTRAVSLQAIVLTCRVSPTSLSRSASRHHDCTLASLTFVAREAITRLIHALAMFSLSDEMTLMHLFAVVRDSPYSCVVCGLVMPNFSALSQHRYTNEHKVPPPDFVNPTDLQQ